MGLGIIAWTVVFQGKTNICINDLSYDYNEEYCSEYTMMQGVKVYTHKNGVFDINNVTHGMYQSQPLVCNYYYPTHGLRYIQINNLQTSYPNVEYNLYANCNGGNFTLKTDNDISSIDLSLSYASLFIPKYIQNCYPPIYDSFACSAQSPDGFDLIFSNGSAESNHTINQNCSVMFDYNYYTSGQNISNYLNYYCNNIKNSVYDSLNNTTLVTQYLCKNCFKQWKDTLDILTQILTNCASILTVAYKFLNAIFDYYEKRNNNEDPPLNEIADTGKEFAKGVYNFIEPTDVT
jgi:hypothetical protein